MKEGKFDQWLGKHLESAERAVTAILGIAGFFCLAGHYYLHEGLLSEILRDLGIASLVALFIKLINEIFLSKKILITFQRHRQKLAQDVVSGTFERIIPPQLFSEIKQTILSGLKFMRDRNKITYTFEIDNTTGKLMMEAFITMRIQNLVETDAIYPWQWGTNLDPKWHIKERTASYSFNDEGGSEIVFEVDSNCKRVTKYGKEHDEFSQDILFPKKKKSAQFKIQL